LTLEDGGTQTIDLSALDNAGTDDQNISGSGLSGTDLTIGIENGTNEIVDLSSLVGTDDQIATEVVFTPTARLSSTNTQAAIEEVEADLNQSKIDATNAINANTTAINNHKAADQDTDASNELNTAFAIVNNGTEDVLRITDAAGNLDVLLNDIGSDNQNLTGAALNGSNILQIDIENGTSTTVDLSSLDNSGTDNQNIENLDLTGTTLTVGIEDGFAQTVDLASIDTDTDEQDLTGATLTGNTLQIDIENGASTTVDLSALNDSGTDNQNLTGASLTPGNVLQIDIEDGNSTTVDLSSLSNSGTDDQNIADLAINTSSNILTVGIEDGTSQTVDLSHLDNEGTDNQNIQNLILSGTTLSVGIEDGNSQNVNLASLLGTDNQRADVFSFNPASRLLSLSLQRDGEATRTVDLSSLNNSGTDNQTLTAGATPGSLSISSGNTVTLNVNDADSVIGNEYNTAFAVVGSNLRITDGGGNLDVPLSTIGTDDQFDDEVELRTPIDVDDAGKATVSLETNVQEVIEAIAPITSKAARIFYPPSIAVDASSNGTGRTIDLYTQYTAQFATPAVASTGAPAAIPTYAANDLYYYVTEYDTSVFANVSVSATGVMTYDVVAAPADYNSLINVVFVVK
ncbi:hypothetical protein LCGC14_2122340, partial [marine sediment metagenome]